MIINDKTYDIIKNEKEGYVEEEILKRVTDYYNDFDYIVGDWAYGKLRLKGFYDNNSVNTKEFNNIKNVDKYIKEKCAYGCKYFILKKID